MSDRPPIGWRESVGFETMVSSLPSYSSRIDSTDSLPEEINTVLDLFYNRVRLPSGLTDYTDIRRSGYTDSLSHLFNLEYEDATNLPSQIEDRVDFRLSLFALATSGKVYVENGDATNLDRAFGRDISDVVCSNKVTVVSRLEDTASINFGFSNAEKPESVVYPCSNEEFYVLTTADIERESSLLTEGIPDDEQCVTVSSVLLNRIEKLFSFSSFEDAIDSVRIADDMPVRVHDRKNGIHAVIAPIVSSSARYGDEDWMEINSLEDYSVLI